VLVLNTAFPQEGLCENYFVGSENMKDCAGLSGHPEVANTRKEQ
jgi:hypothetical protein